MKLLSRINLQLNWKKTNSKYSFYVGQEYILPEEIANYLKNQYGEKFEIVKEQQIKEEYDSLIKKMNGSDSKQSGNIIKSIGSNDDKLLWTIGICNYKSIAYLKYQLKGLYEFNEIPFNLIVVDNSNPSEFEKLKILLQPYKNTKLILNSPRTVGAGRQHAEALNIIHKNTKTKYLMVMDPDFFWVRANILKILQSKLDQGCVCVGSPFWSKFIDDVYPAAWGCAYLTSFLQDGDFDHLDSSLTPEQISYFITLGYDTAWKISNKFKSGKYKTFCFKDRFGLPNWIPIKGQHSANFENSIANEKLSHEYSYEDKPIAYHLCRGSYDTNNDFLTTEEQIKNETPKDWIKLRKEYSRFFYNMLRKDGNKSMRIHLHFLCKNEERILPYMFRHYDRYVERYFAHYNTASTDNTLKILKSRKNVTIIEDRHDKLDERFLVEMKNVTWRKYSNPSNCDWVFLIDADEFLYHPDLLGLLERYDREGVTFPTVEGYQMFNEFFPTEEKQMTEIIKKGILYHPYNKQIVLKPDIAPNYSYGCHFASPKGDNVKLSEKPEIKLLHYKIFGDEYPKRRMAVNDTLSDFNKATGCGVYSMEPNSPWNPVKELLRVRENAREVI